jgi:hypothetical protein
MGLLNPVELQMKGADNIAGTSSPHQVETSIFAQRLRRYRRSR